jgi:type I restriction enzyme S subunit
MVKPWPTIKIGDVFDFKNGLSKGKEYFGQGTPFISYVEVYKLNGLTAADIKGRVRLAEDEIRKLAVKKNDVFFTRTSETPEEVGYSAVLLEDVPNCVFNGFVLRARPRNNWLDPEYCKYCFLTKRVREEISKRCKYTTRAGITGRALSEIEIPLPPIEEQRAIANTLTSMENYIDKLFQMIEKKKAIRDGALEDLVSGKTRLNGFNEEWETTTVGNCVSILQGGTPSTTNPRYWDGNIVWVTPGEITKLSGMYISSSERMITEAGLENSSATMLPEGTILLCTRATIGDLAIATKPMTTNQGFKNLICKIGYHNVFMAYLLKTMKNTMLSLAIGTTFLEISKKNLAAIQIRVPVFEEQKAIADALTAMDEEIQALKTEREKMIQIREGAMDDLLTGRVRLAV